MEKDMLKDSARESGVYIAKKEEKKDRLKEKSKNRKRTTGTRVAPRGQRDPGGWGHRRRHRAKRRELHARELQALPLRWALVEVGDWFHGRRFSCGGAKTTGATAAPGAEASDWASSGLPVPGRRSNKPAKACFLHQTSPKSPPGPGYSLVPYSRRRPALTRVTAILPHRGPAASTRSAISGHCVLREGR